jgi:glycosyltransferase involved in cell wall biosynthesis
MANRISVVVCAHNEERWLPACIHSLLAQTRPADEIVVVDNASTDRTLEAVSAIAGIRVVREPRKGLVVARETGRRETTGDLLAYLDADGRAPLHWLERLERRFDRHPRIVGLSGPFRFYDWDLASRALLKAYDFTLAPATHVMAQHLLGIGAVFYGGGFCVRRSALDDIGGFDTSIEFHGEDTNLGRRLANVGHVALSHACWVYTSARRYRALGRMAVFRVYVRNFWWETVRHRPRDVDHADIQDLG